MPTASRPSCTRSRLSARTSRCRSWWPSSTRLAPVAVDRAVQLIDAAAPRLLVQTVDVLRDDGAERSLLLQFRERQMRGVRLLVQRQHFLAVEPVKFLGVAVEKAVT